MSGCNCESPKPDSACCDEFDKFVCDVPKPRNYYCGFCEGKAATHACHLWLDTCQAIRIATTLSNVRFKTQGGRDSVFGILTFSSAVQFNKYSRFRESPSVDLNSPSIFDTLCGIASAAAYRDRLGEKTHFKVRDKKNHGDMQVMGNWSYNDSSTSYHKHVTLLKTLMRRGCVTRADFERKYGVTWVPAGTATIVVNDLPKLLQLDRFLAQSCYGLWIDGAFMVSETLQDSLKFDPSFLVYPVNSWDTVIPSHGFVYVIRPTGNVDIYEYNYVCRTFQFVNNGSSVEGTKEGILDLIDSIESGFESKQGKGRSCPGWLTVAKKQIAKELEELPDDEVKDKDKKRGGKPDPSPEDGLDVPSGSEG